jgi:L-ascorbate metabolism protein UlaG (beta-lactamase superfamily)
VPLGRHAGDLCRNDRALLFEDPTGVRILYDPGRTVDESDPRLGEVDVMLLSHAHTDHIGDTRPNRSAPGTHGDVRRHGDDRVALLPSDARRVEHESDTATLGPNEAIYVIKNLVRPRTVMPTHVNEQATSGGVIRPGTRVDFFNLFVRDYADVVVPVSDVTRTFDGSGRCIGCR